MSSAFNLSTLVAMQDQRVEQTSVYFWRCQLTSANPRFVWNPEAPAEKKSESTDAATSKEAGDKKAAADADIGESTESDGENDDEDDAISTRHLLQVSGCVLGPKATGVHLVTVRTSTSYQKRQATGKPQAEPATADAAAASASEPDACPIVCMDPAAQRTLALSHEFVLEKQQPQAQLTSQHAHPAAGTCVFELAEGSGPVWLTGTHRIHRVVPVSGAADDESEDDDDGEEENADEEVGEGEEAEDESNEEDEEEEEEEEIEEEADDDEDMIEEVKPLPPASKKAKQQKGGAASAATTKASQAKRKPQSTAAGANGKVARKRVRPDS